MNKHFERIVSKNGDIFALMSVGVGEKQGEPNVTGQVHTWVTVGVCGVYTTTIFMERTQISK